MDKRHLKTLISAVFFTIWIGLAGAIVPDAPLTKAPSNCTLRVKNDTGLPQPITLGTVNLSASSYATVSIPSGAWGSLTADCDALANFSQKPNAGLVLSKNSETTYVLVLPVVNPS